MRRLRCLRTDKELKASGAGIDGEDLFNVSTTLRTITSQIKYEGCTQKKVSSNSKIASLELT